MVRKNSGITDKKIIEEDNAYVMVYFTNESSQSIYHLFAEPTALVTFVDMYQNAVSNRQIENENQTKNVERQAVSLENNALSENFSSEEVLQIYNDAYDAHVNKHENGFYIVKGIDGLSEVLDSSTRIYYPQKEKIPQGLHVCIEAQKENDRFVATSIPETFAPYVNELVQTYFAYSGAITVPGENKAVALERISEVMTMVPGSEWLIYKELPDKSRIAMAPIFWLNTSGEILDDSITLLFIRETSSEKGDSIWFCADQDIVWNILDKINKKLSSEMLSNGTSLIFGVWLDIMAWKINKRKRQ